MKSNEKYENLKCCENLKIWLEMLLKIKPNEKYENLKFCENLKIWLEILLKIKPNQKYQNLNLLRKPPHLAGNPFKNQAKRKVSKSQIITKTSKFGRKSF